MNSRIKFYSEEINFILHNRIKVKKWLSKVIDEEGKGQPAISYVFCSDPYLLELNKKYLNHTSFTDILTFPDVTTDGKMTGDIFISIDRIRENAEKYDQPFETELYRVMVHGALHLLGYNDKSKKDKELMTSKEDYYLSMI